MEAVLNELNNLKLSNDGSKSLESFTDEEDILIQSDAKDNTEIPTEGKGASKIINTQLSRGPNEVLLERQNSFPSKLTEPIKPRQTPKGMNYCDSVRANYSHTPRGRIEFKASQKIGVRFDKKTGFGIDQKESFKFTKIDKKKSISSNKSLKSVNNVKNSLKSLVHADPVHIKKPFKKKVPKDRKSKFLGCSRPGLKNDNKDNSKISNSIIPEELPSNTRRFVEPSTNKVLYFTCEGKIYTEDKSGRLMQLDGLESIFPQNGQNTVQNKGRHAKNSYSENATTFNNPKELQFGKPEAFMEPEPFMQFSKSLYHENIPFMSPRVGQMEMGLVQEDS